MGPVHAADMALGAGVDLALKSSGFTLSVVIPAYNEVENLPLLVDELQPVLESLPGAAWEVIMVDDGSTDGTSEIMARLALQRLGFRAVMLRAHCGKSTALMAGFREAKGEVVITMDADLQDDPVEIPRFLEELGRGNDMVS